MEEVTKMRAEAPKLIRMNTEAQIEKDVTSVKNETYLARLKQVEEARTDAELRNIRNDLVSLPTTSSETQTQRATQSSERLAQEAEVTKVYLSRKSDGWATTLTLPKNYTKENLTEAIQALGEDFADYEVGYDWKSFQGLNTLFRDIWKKVAKAFQAVT